MRDPEFIELRNKFLIGVVVAILFAIPVMIFVYKSFNVKESDVLTNIKKKEDMVIFLSSNTCDLCSGVEDILKEKNVSYLTLNIDKNVDYKEVMRRFHISEKVVEVPGIIKVEDGKMVSNMMRISDKNELNEFLDFHELLNTEE